MVIRKPNLSVQEARQLSKARNAALDNDLPFKPIEQQAKSGTARLASEVANTPPAPRTAARPPVDSNESVDDATVQVFLSAPLPANGISRSFDYLSKQYAPSKALRMVLRRALDDYEEHLENGGYEAFPTEYDVSSSSPKIQTIQTSRIMPVVLLRRARAYFDPLGFESERAFGRKLASAALAAFFASEAKR